jgi:CrcB protein
MLKNILLVGIGGLIGSSLRYLAVTYFSNAFPSRFPTGTFAVNIFGCLLIGIFAGLSERLNWMPELSLFVAIGIFGGFTTFSSFSIENLRLLQEREYLSFGLYAVGSLVLGLFATFAGLSLTTISK